MSDSDENICVNQEKSTKKRKKYGRLTDVAKKLRASTFETGKDCQCKRYKCFQNISVAEQSELIRQFNNIGRENGNDAQNSYLSGLISLRPVFRRRPRQNEEDARLNESSYSYKVRVIRDGSAVEVPVCFKAFQSLFGIKAFRLHTIKTSLRTTGKAPIDGRGKHTTRPHKLSQQTRELLLQFFGSLKGRKAHYSLKDSNRVYLPEEMNVKKLLELFLTKHPHIEMCYETFRQIFMSEFNIAFGYPRTETCCWCDEQKAKITELDRKIAAAKSDDEKVKLEEKVRKLETKKTLHLKKANWFYELKRRAKTEARKSSTVEAIAIDFGKNLPTPNITSAEVYFKRQLSFYIFNVHILSSGASIMYTYDQTVAKKGSNDVASMLYHFFNTYLDPAVKKLYIFADSCGGQNKNHTIIQFFHYITAELKRFDTVTITYPVRGHSFMEPDKNMGLIPKCAKAETPDGWREVIEAARTKPYPFVVVSCEQVMFKGWGNFLSSKLYKKKFPFPIRQLKQLMFFETKCKTVDHRETYNGTFTSSLIKDQRKNQKRKSNTLNLQEPNQLYHRPIPLPKEKCADLKVLMKFCEEEGSKEYYSQLLSTNQPELPSGLDDVPDDQSDF